MSTAALLSRSRARILRETHHNVGLVQSRKADGDNSIHRYIQEQYQTLRYFSALPGSCDETKALVTPNPLHDAGAAVFPDIGQPPGKLRARRSSLEYCSTDSRHEPGSARRASGLTWVESPGIRASYI